MYLVLCGNFKRSQLSNFNKDKKSLPFCVGIVLYWKHGMENHVLTSYYLSWIRIINHWHRRLLFLLEILNMFAFDSWILMYSDSNKVRVVFLEISFQATWFILANFMVIYNLFPNTSWKLSKVCKGVFPIMFLIYNNAFDC